jgi:hypothetical protein
MIYRQSLNTTESQSQETRERLQQAQLKRQFRAGLSLDHDTDLKETTRRVRLMANVEKLDVYVDHSFRHEDSHEFFVAIGSLPKLSTVRLRSNLYVGPSAKIPVSALQALLENRNLRSLHLHHVELSLPEEAEDPCSLIAIAKLMEENNSLKELRINSGITKIPRDSQQAFFDMLRYKNFSLEILEFDDPSVRKIPYGKRKQMNFYLDLNRTGIRRNLLHAESDVTSQQWKDAVISNRNQSSVCYYLLSHNPAIICE